MILVPWGVHPPVSKSLEMLGDVQRQCRCQRPNEPWKKILLDTFHEILLV